MILKLAQNDKNPADLPFRLGGRCSWEQRVCRPGGKPNLEGEISMDLNLFDIINHQEAMESNDFEEDFKFEDDAISESSGDSILIGVEDQTEFNDYTEKIKEIDVDMDLYSKLQGNRQVKLFWA